MQFNLPTAQLSSTSSISSCQRNFSPSSPLPFSSPSPPPSPIMKEDQSEDNPIYKQRLQQQIQDLISVHHEKLRFELKTQIQKHHELHLQQQAGIKQQVKTLIKKYQERKVSGSGSLQVGEKLENILREEGEKISLGDG